MEPSSRKLSELPILHNFTEALSDPDRHLFFSFETPARFPKPSLVSFFPEVLTMLEIDHREAESEDFAKIFSGSSLLNGSRPFSLRYGGHQFGSWAGELGDGRAVVLCEMGTSGGSFFLQVKGTGPTEFSRGFDGRAVLRSCIREYLCSEALHRLGVPSVRTLCCVITGEKVERDQQYDGHPRAEPGAAVCRVARSLTRFGSFEILAASGSREPLSRLLRLSIERDFPHLADLPEAQQVSAFLAAVCSTTASLVAHWQACGFVHGVMNTDNLSILGETIDFGPFGFLEDYDPLFTPNSTDFSTRRYAYGNQPKIAAWNLAMLANALVLLVKDQKPLNIALQSFADTFRFKISRLFGRKLGFPQMDEESFFPLKAVMDRFLEKSKSDFTIFFQELAEQPLEDLIQNPEDRLRFLKIVMYSEPSEEIDELFFDFIEAYKQLLEEFKISEENRVTVMRESNPRYILRNYILFEAIKKAEDGDYSMVKELEDMLRSPYAKNERFEKFYAKRPKEYDGVPGCSTLSCSS